MMHALLPSQEYFSYIEPVMITYRMVEDPEHQEKSPTLKVGCVVKREKSPSIDFPRSSSIDLKSLTNR